MSRQRLIFSVARNISDQGLGLGNGTTRMTGIQITYLDLRGSDRVRMWKFQFMQRGKTEATLEEKNIKVKDFMVVSHIILVIPR